MTPRSSRGFVFVLLLMLVAAGLACGKQPRVDVAVEERLIREAGKAWLAAEVAKDIPKIVSFYAEDAIEMASNTPLIQGRDAIRQWYESWLAPAGVAMTFETQEVVVAPSGDLAYERGTYRFTQDSPRGATEDVGKYLTVWKKVEGKWQVAVDAANSDRPCQ
jgi:ketosteroid isomerase-like protein